MLILFWLLWPAVVRKGAFQPGQSANFNGKIIYEECRKPVWTPSNWDPKLAERSAELPDVRLQLEFAYGHAGVKVQWQVAPLQIQDPVPSGGMMNYQLCTWQCPAGWFMVARKAMEQLTCYS